MVQDEFPPINKKIEARRTALGLSVVDVAHKVNLSIYEYGDIEYHADEIFIAVPLYHIKKLCRVLQLDYFELFEMPCAFCEQGMPQHEDYWLHRDELAQRRRESLGLSREELRDQVDVYDCPIELIESYTAHLESWVIINIYELADTLQIPRQVLLDVQCPRCGL
jgi:DNA-binding XRE family transcriptional regulator